ncbi:MAG: hypothetical protein H6R27_818 [Proteobacteria bacterium]|nr:hypothetical protein [Pseudomonadota bacterium]
MRARNEPDEVTPLPAPPAPPARDANPWPLPELDRPAIETPSPRRPRRRDGTPEPGKATPRIAVLAAFALLVLGLAAARMMEGGDAGDLAEALLPLLLLVIFIASRFRRRRKPPVGERRNTP